MGWLALAIVLAVWQTLAFLDARDRVLTRARQGCKALNLQLLDDTVAQVRLRPARGPAGRLCWRRDFRFEFSTNGTDRRQGNATLLGTRLELLRLELPDGPVLLDGTAAVERLH